MLNDNHRDWEAAGLPSREVDRLDDMVTGFRTERLSTGRALRVF